MTREEKYGPDKLARWKREERTTNSARAAAIKCYKEAFTPDKYERWIVVLMTRAIERDRARIIEAAKANIKPKGFVDIGFIKCLVNGERIEIE